MSSDILDVFNISEPLQKKPKKDAQQNKSSQQLQGINRELYNLLGENTPAINIQKQSKSRLKNISKKRPGPWNYVSFTNGSRTDGLQLKHWAKGYITPEHYFFEQFNQGLKLPKFDRLIYDRLIKKDDAKHQNSAGTNPWTFQETQYLFDLCNRFDLRWFVIYDRYEEFDARTLEDLKERFYSVCIRILSEEIDILRKAGIMDESKTQLLAKLQKFNKGKEIKRKEYLNRLLNRSPAEIAEEESLVIEARRFENSAQKTLAERANLLNLLDSPQSNVNVSQYLTSNGIGQLYNALMFDKKKKIGNNNINDKSSMANLTKSTGTGIAIAGSSEISTANSTDHINSNDPIAVLLMKELSPEEQAMYGISYFDKADGVSQNSNNNSSNSTTNNNSSQAQQSQKQVKQQQGVHLRSSKLSVFKPAVQSKVGAILDELNIPKRPVLLTEEVYKKFELLTEAISNLADAKKVADKLQTEKILIEKS